MGVALGVLLTNLISQNLVLIGVQPEYNKFVFGIFNHFRYFCTGIAGERKKKNAGVAKNAAKQT